MTAEVAPRTSLSIVLIASIFVVAGIAHFMVPTLYVGIMPPWLPAPRALVMTSGAFEILGGVCVLVPSTRVAAAWGLVALLFAVFPANVQMLLNARAANASLLWQAALLVRLPLQAVLVYWVYRAAVRTAA